ncbi:MAG: hypothetical protein WBB01_12550, partial [Phormidesmis sp.]
PNSTVKHRSGEDSEGASPCQNSSMPGPLFKAKPPYLRVKGAFVILLSFFSVESLSAIGNICGHI